MKEYLLPVITNQVPINFTNQQLKIFWLPDEVKVEKDIQDVLTNFTEAEKHAVISTLRLFSIYETHAGDEYWGGRFKEIMQTAEWHRMASVFSMFELAVHMPFYNKINELLYINTSEFYNSYKQDPALLDRVKHLGSIIDNPNPAVSLAVFTLIEGVILYSSFAFLKHYQSNGKNKLMNVVRGINFSVRDEWLHARGSAAAFRELTKGYSEQQMQAIKQEVDSAIESLIAHEDILIDALFSKGKIEGITDHQLKQFVRSRVNECLQELGFKKQYEATYNPIADWFYKGINDYNFNDFFTAQGREYNRSWSETDFVWQ